MPDTLLKRYMARVMSQDHIVCHRSVQGLLNLHLTEAERAEVVATFNQLRDEEDMADWLPEMTMGKQEKG